MNSISQLLCSSLFTQAIRWEVGPDGKPLFSARLDEKVGHIQMLCAGQKASTSKSKKKSAAAMKGFAAGPPPRLPRVKSGGNLTSKPSTLLSGPKWGAKANVNGFESSSRTHTAYKMPPKKTGMPNLMFESPKKENPVRKLPPKNDIPKMQKTQNPYYNQNEKTKEQHKQFKSKIHTVLNVIQGGHMTEMIDPQTLSKMFQAKHEEKLMCYK